MTVTAHRQRPDARLATLATAQITVACADRYELARLGVAYLTRRYPDLQLVGEAGGLAEVHALVVRVRPAVLVIGDDLALEGGMFTAGLRAAHPALGLVVVSHHADDALLHRFRTAGVSAFVSRSAPVTAALAAIRQAAAMPRRFGTFGVPWAVERDVPRTLSPREHQVLELLREGLSAGQIATRLGMGPGTVRTHVTRLYAKLGVSSRSQALMVAAGSRSAGPGHRSTLVSSASRTVVMVPPPGPPPQRPPGEV